MTKILAAGICIIIIAAIGACSLIGDPPEPQKLYVSWRDPDYRLRECIATRADIYLNYVRIRCREGEVRVTGDWNVTISEFPRPPKPPEK